MKNELLEALAQLWEKYPDMRLGQLMDWVAGVIIPNLKLAIL